MREGKICNCIIKFDWEERKLYVKISAVGHKDGVLLRVSKYFYMVSKWIKILVHRISISSKIFERLVLKFVITERQITKKYALNLVITKAKIFKGMALKLVITEGQIIEKNYIKTVSHRRLKY